MSLLPEPPPSALLTALLAAEDPTTAEQLDARAAAHFARTRARRAPSPRGEGPAPAGPRVYRHAGPTRSEVLNAFVHELGGRSLVRAGVTIPNEHLLAARLLEIVRGCLSRFAVARGNVGVGLIFATELPQIRSEGAARIYLRQAAHASGELGVIARDYEAQRRKAGARPDRLASCMVAAFAGRMVVYADELIGPHVLDDVRAELTRLAMEEQPATRRAPARAGVDAGRAPPAQGRLRRA